MKNSKQKKQQGFTLIELMIVVAVIGVLAAIAVPQYQNYVKKGALGTALASASAHKTIVEDHIAFSNSFPSISAAFGIGTITATSGALATGTSTNDIVAKVTEGSGTGATITLKRDVDGNWTCENSLSSDISISGCS
ncbi:pilin [Vibrio alginolyticus]|uniref:pilin n=1 Tax=Vibrio alginolyticus TaxID=663 RepID=UPI001EEC303B|nr:pilin [Vibrio alginolyticus]EMB9234410.1 pilin [Vibrio alginolyticus]MCG6317651.1 pilin [Vibrio alginolyticus]